MPTILVFPNKLDSTLFESNQAPAGSTLAQWLKDTVPAYAPREVPLFSATLNGADFTPAQWQSIVLKESDIVSLTVEAKEPATIIMAVIAGVSVATTIYTMSNIPDNYNSTTPKGSSIYDANAQGNKPKLMGVIPELFGRHKTYPDLLSQPHRYYEYNDQYIELMLAVGVGEYDLDDIMIGNTLIEHYGDDIQVTKYEPGASTAAIPVIYTSDEVGSTAGTSGIELTHQKETVTDGEGDLVFILVSGGTQVEFYQNGIYQQDHNLAVDDSVTLTGENAGDYTVKEIINDYKAVFNESVGSEGSYPTTWVATNIDIAEPVGPFRAAPATVAVTEAHLDFLFVNGLCKLNDNGVPQERSVTIRVSHADNIVLPYPFDMEALVWLSEDFTYTGDSLDQLAFTETITVSPEMPLVKVERLTEDDDDTKVRDKVEWVGLKSTLPSVASYDDVTTVHLKLKGTNAIARNAENKFNLVASRKLNGSATRSIADAFEYIVKDNGHTDAQIDQTELARLKTIWDNRGDTFDALFDSDSTIFAALKRVLAVGFAEPTLDHGQIIPVRDEPRSGFNYMYQPDNMLKPLQRSIKLFDPDEADGVEVEYFSTDTWKPETILCLLDGDQGINPKKIRAYGITDRTNAWQFGMRKRREIRYRRTEYSFETEMDGLNSGYLSYDSLADDVPGFSQTGRVDAVNGSALELNQPVEFDAGTHYIALRKPDGTLDGPHICTAGTHDQQVVLSGSLGFTPDCSGRIEPPLYQFGSATRWNHPVLITEINPSGTDRVRIKAVNYDARVYADDDNSPPV